MQKPRIALLISGEMRANSLNPDYNKDSIILDSISKYLINDDFKSKYDHDVFISTDKISLEQSEVFFGSNLKNINITETGWYLNKFQTQVPNYSYFYDRYLSIDFKGNYPFIQHVF